MTRSRVIASRKNSPPWYSRTGWEKTVSRNRPLRTASQFTAYCNPSSVRTAAVPSTSDVPLPSAMAATMAPWATVTIQSKLFIWPAARVPASRNATATIRNAAADRATTFSTSPGRGEQPVAGGTRVGGGEVGGVRHDGGV